MGGINYEMHKRRDYSDSSPYPEIEVLSPGSLTVELTQKH